MISERDVSTRHNLFSVDDTGVEYDNTKAQLLTMLISRMQKEHDCEYAFIQQYLYHKGIKIFG